MADLVFYTNPMSRGRIVRWMLEEVGQPYRTELMQYGAEMKSASYTAINPMGKVPALTHDGQVVTECAGICAYLADAFPAAGLAPPPGDVLRTSYYRWLFFAAGPLEAAVTNKAMKFEVPEGRQGMSGYGSFEVTMQTLEGALAGRDYLVGEAFSAADVYVGSQIGWGMMFGSIEKRPVFTAYFDRLSARPAYIRARDTDDALIPARQPEHAGA